MLRARRQLCDQTADQLCVPARSARNKGIRETTQHLRRHMRYRTQTARTNENRDMTHKAKEQTTVTDRRTEYVRPVNYAAATRPVRAADAIALAPTHPTHIYTRTHTHTHRHTDTHRHIHIHTQSVRTEATLLGWPGVGLHALL